MSDQPSFIKNRSLEMKWAREQLKILKKKQVLAFKEKWFDTSDVLMALRISRGTLQKLRDRGTLPFVRLFGKFFYKAKDLDTLLNSRYNKTKKSSKHE